MININPHTLEADLSNLLEAVKDTQQQVLGRKASYSTQGLKEEYARLIASGNLQAKLTRLEQKVTTLRNDAPQALLAEEWRHHVPVISGTTRAGAELQAARIMRRGELNKSNLYKWLQELDEQLAVSILVDEALAQGVATREEIMGEFARISPLTAENAKEAAILPEVCTNCLDPMVTEIRARLQDVKENTTHTPAVNVATYLQPGTSYDV